MKNTMNTRLAALSAALLFAALAAAGGGEEEVRSPSAPAMPGKAETATALALVEKQMAPFAARLKDGKTAAEDVAQEAVRLANAAKDPAAKYLLMKEAAAYFARAKRYDLATEAVAITLMWFPAIEPEAVLELAAGAAEGATAADAPELFAMQRCIKAMKAHKTRPEDKDTIRSLAELIVISGFDFHPSGEKNPRQDTWERACEFFARLDGDVGRIAQEELAGGFSPVAHADFWWDYEPQENSALWRRRSVRDELRARAVKYYLDDLKNLSGADRKRAEQRIMQCR